MTDLRPGRFVLCEGWRLVRFKCRMCGTDAPANMTLCRMCYHTFDFGYFDLKAANQGFRIVSDT